MNNLSQLTIHQTLEGLKKKKFTSKDVVLDLQKRIQNLDKKINAYVSLNENAVKEAEEADKKRSEGNKEAQPLLGIPFSLKDNICTVNIKTTASSNILKEYVPPYDATIVEKLKKAGAIILGKTNMDAWAHGSSTETSDFFTTKNPWDVNKLPGGSSGGSAASVISDMTIGSVGTETAGSIRHPASWCGVVGFKPTYGRVSRYGVIAMGSSLDSPGPMSKNIEDAALTLEVLAGHDTNDATSAPRSVEKYSQNLQKEVKNIKIGVATEYIEASDKKIQQKITEAIKIWESMGVKVSDVTLLDPKYAIAVYTILQRAEVSSNLARLDGIRYGNGREFFGNEAKRRIMMGTYALSTGYYDALYIKAQKVRTLIVEDFKKVFQNVDAIIGPTTPCTALPIGASNSSPIFGEMQDVLVEPSTIAGLPGVNIPAGFIDEMPVGLQIIGPQFSEASLLNLAYHYEKNTEWHTKRPKM